MSNLKYEIIVSCTYTSMCFSTDIVFLSFSFSEEITFQLMHVEKIGEAVKLDKYQISCKLINLMFSKGKLPSFERMNLQTRPNMDFVTLDSVK